MRHYRTFVILILTIVTISQNVNFISHNYEIFHIWGVISHIFTLYLAVVTISQNVIFYISQF